MTEPFSSLNPTSVRVAITGGGGFLGSEILRQCRERGWNVVAIGRTPRPELNGEGVRFVPEDISRSENLDKLAEIFTGTDIVFHTAAKAGVWGKYTDFEQANLTGTRNVVEACRRASVRNLVYTSTPSVTFNGSAIRGGNESLPYYTGKLSPYAKTKAEAEALVLSAHSPELRTVALRPHLIWGIGDPHLLPRVIEQAAQMKLRIVGNGANKVDLTHVANAAHAHLLAAEALLTDNPVLCENPSGNGKAYFVSDDAPIPLWEWINTFLSKLGIPVVTQKISFNAAYRAGALLEFFWKIFGVAGEPPITRFVAIELSHDHWFDISALKKDLGYAPVVSGEDALRALIGNYQC